MELTADRFRLSERVAMPVRRFVLVGLVAIAFAATEPAPASAQQVTVSGIAYRIDNAGKYHTLPGVVIQAYRAGPLLKNPAMSQADGSFEFDVPEGEPFSVSFHGNQLVPELTHVAGNSKAPKNVVNIALLSPAQYKKMAAERKLPPLNEKLNCTLRNLPEGSDAAKEIRLMLGK